MIDISLTISEWLEEFKSAGTKIDDISTTVFGASVEELKQITIEYTPIGKPELWKYPAHKDYTPGTLKANWEIEYEGKYTAILGNSTPYAYRVEYGWSSQAPEGMLRKSVALFPKIVSEIAEKHKI